MKKLFFFFLIIFLCGCISLERLEKKYISFPKEDMEEKPLNLIFVLDFEYLEDFDFSVLKGLDKDNYTVLFPSVHLKKLKEEQENFLKDLQDNKIIEVGVTPYYNNILPLIYDTNVVKKINSNAILPTVRFSFPSDVKANIYKTVSIYKDYFNIFPKGFCFPADAISEEVLGIFPSVVDYWVIISEDAFAQIDNIYQPIRYKTERNNFTFLIRDKKCEEIFSNKSFDKELKIEKLLNRIDGIKKKSSLLTVYFTINSYEDMQIVSELTNRILMDKHLRLVLPTAYLSKNPETKQLLHFYPTFSYGSYRRWIGSEEKNKAWEYLYRTRKFIEDYKNSGKANISDLGLAFNYIYKAEQSKWFSIFDSTDISKQNIDAEFRDLLAKVYSVIGKEIPNNIFIPIAESELTENNLVFISPIIDGNIEEKEWENSKFWISEDTQSFINSLYVGVNEKNLFLRIDSKVNLKALNNMSLNIYLFSPEKRVNNLTLENQIQLGIPLSYRISIKTDDKGNITSFFDESLGKSKWHRLRNIFSIYSSTETTELSIPLSYIPLKKTEVIKVKGIFFYESLQEIFPLQKELSLVLNSNLDEQTLLYIVDPVADDYGYGSYRYPTNELISKGSFDINFFRVKRQAQSLIFIFGFSNLSNNFPSPLGIGPLQLEVYIDLNNRINVGNLSLLSGRNAFTLSEDAWEYVILVNGWKQALFKLDSSGKLQKVCNLHTEIRGNCVIFHLSLNKIKGNPSRWGYIPLVTPISSLDKKILEIKKQPDDIHFGGGEKRNIEPNIIDVVLPEGFSQEKILSMYKKKRGVVIPAIRIKQIF